MPTTPTVRRLALFPAAATALLIGGALAAAPAQAWDFVNAGVSKEFLTLDYMNSLKGAVVDDCREHCFSCGILGYFKEQRRDAPDAGWGCPPLGRDKDRQPVSVTPIPLYFNDDMSPDRTGQFAERVPQRRGGTVSKRVGEQEIERLGE